MEMYLTTIESSFQLFYFSVICYFSENLVNNYVYGDEAKPDWTKKWNDLDFSFYLLLHFLPTFLV